MLVGLKLSLPALAVLLFSTQLSFAAGSDAGGSIVASDPSVHVTTLANGMKGVFRANTLPTHGVSILFAIEAGSLNEQDGELGLAHFVEHMALKGSTHFPDGAGLKTLARYGIAAGADVNGTTLPDRTVYSFNLPDNDPVVVQTTLQLIRDIASEVSFDKESVDKERGVVLSEIQLRNTPDFRARLAASAFYFGTSIGRRLNSGGDPSVVSKATPSSLREFYRTNYLPDRATLIIVGDVDVASMQQQVATLFDTWPVPPNTKPKWAPDPVTAPKDTVRVYSEPGLPSLIAFSSVTAHLAAADDEESERRSALRTIALMALKLRLETLESGNNSPILDSGTVINLNGYSDVRSFWIRVQPGKEIDATAAAGRLWGDIQHNGFAQADVERSIERLRNETQSPATADDVVSNSALAQRYLSFASQGREATTTIDQQRILKTAIQTLSANDVTNALHELFPGRVLIFAETQQAPADTEGLLEKAWLTGTADRQQPQTITPSRVVAWPYTSFGEPGSIISRQTDEKAGVTLAKFANGTSVAIKPTQNRAGQVLVSLRFGSGRGGLSHDRSKLAAWYLAINSLVQGGLGHLTVTDLQDALRRNHLHPQMSMTDDAFYLECSSTPDTLNLALQVLAAYATDPGWDESAVERAQAAIVEAFAREPVTSSAVSDLKLASLLSAGDIRWDYPTATELAAASRNKASEQMNGALGEPLGVSVVGDITVEQALNAVARTLGALKRSKTIGRVEFEDRKFPAPSAAPTVLYYPGTGLATVVEAWPTVGQLPDPQQTRVLEVLDKILTARLVDKLRVAEGAAYQIDSNLEFGRPPSRYGYVAYSATLSPSNTNTFFDTLNAIARDLRSTSVSNDELDRARETAALEATRTTQRNMAWTDRLGDVLNDPRVLGIFKDHAAGLRIVSAADVRRAAQKFLGDHTSYRVVILPAAGATTQ